LYVFISNKVPRHDAVFAWRKVLYAVADGDFLPVCDVCSNVVSFIAASVSLHRIHFNEGVTFFPTLRSFQIHLKAIFFCCPAALVADFFLRSGAYIWTSPLKPNSRRHEMFRSLTFSLPEIAKKVTRS